MSEGIIYAQSAHETVRRLTAGCAHGRTTMREVCGAKAETIRTRTRVRGAAGIWPAVAAGIADHLWSYEEIAELAAVAEDAKPRKRGPYRKRGEKSLGLPAPL